MRILFKTILFVLLFCGFAAHATHNRAGEIRYVRIAPFTKKVGGQTVQVYTYSITVVKYTNDGPTIADRCVDTVDFGDGERGIAIRIDGPAAGCNCGTILGQPVHCGTVIIAESDYRVKVNTYTVVHTYPGPGSYKIKSFDPNRNEHVHNIPNSVNLPFYIESQLIINTFTGANSSPIFAFAPIDRACLGVCFEHNPGAFDPDGDSLSYEISTSRGANGQTVIGYTFPDSGTGGTYGINAITGELRWCNPQLAEEYNLAFIVKEWRKNTSNEYKMIGYVLRDMQVIVRGCPQNQPPAMTAIPDTCVEAGAEITKTFFVSDANSIQKVQISGGGGAFNAEPPIATVSPTLVSANAGSTQPVTFRWKTTCDHIQQQSYITGIKLLDDGQPVKLPSFTSFVIRVVPPAVKNVTAIPQGSTMKISWDASTCNPSANPLKEYRVYRKDNCDPFVFDPCKKGVPPNSGYQLIGVVKPPQVSFVDDNKGDGLVVGQNYSYLVVTAFNDGAESFGSAQVCSKLKRDVPVVINVDVLSTSADTGRVLVRWLKPLTGGENLDLTQHPGPYTFNLKHRLAGSGDYTIVYSNTTPDFNQLKERFEHTLLNTEAQAHEYLVEFYSGSVSIGSSQRAASVFLSTVPSDRRIDLSWSFHTPWNNYKYSVFRKDPASTTFTHIADTDQKTYADTKNVVNGETYCYYILSEGEYSDPSIQKPLLNKSQQKCETAVDRTPPATPTVSADADCPSGRVVITWSDIKDKSDDVSHYELFFKPFINDEYVKVVTAYTTQPYVYHSDRTDISGCYAARAVDINGNTGALSTDLCIDNCPEFELPNVFTPNADDVNDHFMAIKVRQILEINLTVTDRWGNLAYKTRDPYFKWDGINVVSNNPASEGTYFYVCEVFEKRLKGITKRTLQGSVHLAR